jgi:hypothetical protein
MFCVSVCHGTGGSRLVSKQLLQTRLFFGALGTAHVRPGHINQVFAAKGGYFKAPVQPKQSLLDSGLQDQIGAAVRSENSWNRTIRAIFRLPVCRTGIPINQAARLFITPAMEVLIIKTAFLPGRSNHNSFPGT